MSNRTTPNTKGQYLQPHSSANRSPYHPPIQAIFCVCYNTNPINFVLCVLQHQSNPHFLCVLCVWLVPTCARLSSIMLLAAGCETSTSRRMQCPSLVMTMPPIGSVVRGVGEGEEGVSQP